MNEGSPDLGAMVTKLLGNPELLSQIASTVGVEMPPAEEKSAPPEGEARPTSAPPNMGGLLSLMGGSGGSGRRTALLSALKPFCNEHRCRTIDYMISISKLSENLIPPKRG